MSEGKGLRRAPGDGGRTRPGPIVWSACLVALVLVVWGVLAQTTYAVLPAGWDAESLVLQAVTIDGFEPQSAGELEYLLRRLYEPDQEVPLPRDGETVLVALVPEVEGITLWVTLLNALAFWAVCAFALAPRLGFSGVPDLFVTLLLAAITIAIGGVSPPHHSAAGPLPVIYVIALALMPAFFVRFGLSFPRRLPLLERYPYLPVPVFLVAMGVASSSAIALLRCFAAPGSERWPETVASSTALLLLLAAGGFLGCLALWWNGRQAPSPRAKRQVRWILFSIAIGAAPYVLFRALFRSLDLPESPIDPTFDRIVEMAIPVAFAIAVVKEQFLDIDVIIRRSLLYTLLALCGALLFFVTAILLSDLLVDLLGVSEAVMWALAGALTGLLYRPVRRTLGRWIDRTFFRIRMAHEQALDVLRRALAPASGQAELATVLGRFLDRGLEPRTHGVVVWRDDEREMCGTLDRSLLEAARDLLAGLPTHPEGPVARAGTTACPDIESDAFPGLLAEAGVDLVEPILGDGRSGGLLLLGGRRDERHWVQEDVELLEAAAEEAGTVLERLDLVQHAAEEAMARRTLAAVSRQKTDFFARLAHDLRTPITAVRWSTRNLLDGLPGPLTDHQRRYLLSVEASTGQLDRLVSNLVDLGRLDLAAPERSPEPVDLRAVVEETALALTAVTDEREARIEIDAPDGLPAARGRPEAAFQVVINLVENALKHTPAGTTVEIALRDIGGALELTVRDHGFGLPETGRERLFDLFQQGDAEGERKTGYGIGLYIVRAWSEALGGTVEADNHPEGGACFTCRFPLWDEEETIS